MEEDGSGIEDRSLKSSSSLMDQVLKARIMVVEAYNKKPISHWILLLLGSAGMLVAFPASSLLSRIYFSNGGKSKWIISWVAVAGWPLTALVLIPMYFFLKMFPTPLTLKLAISYVTLGFLSAADNLMYAYAYAYLPASTASLLAASSLVFSALFGYFLVKNKLNASMVNGIVIITAAMAIIALDSSSDRYGNVSSSQYIMGFMWDILGSALHGLIFALSELVFIKLLGKRSFHVVLEQQVMVSLFGFIFTTIGIIINKDFQGMANEARSFDGGKSSYCLVLVWGVTSQIKTKRVNWTFLHILAFNNNVSLPHPPSSPRFRTRAQKGGGRTRGRSKAIVEAKTLHSQRDFRKGDSGERR